MQLVYGVGVGGEYPMTGTITCEVAVPGIRADKLHRGRTVVLAFLMQVRVTCAPTLFECRWAHRLAQLDAASGTFCPLNVNLLELNQITFDNCRIQILFLISLAFDTIVLV